MTSGKLERRSTWCSWVLVAAVALGTAGSLEAQRLDTNLVKAFRWRTIGPAVFEGRVADIVGLPSPSRTFYVAAAAGGIWKTTNDGATYRALFQHERVASMGALAIAPTDTLQIWAGTGEPNSRNSIEPGGGVYKSMDGGLTWKLMGLEKTQHIGRIVVHPANSQIVYVAALGAAWATNSERGLYKTTDGGVTWKLAKFVSDKAGFIDVALDPRNPDVVYASSYERIRGPWFLRSGGPGSALWKSTDGGESWKEIKGNGFPVTMKGRINIAISLSHPDIIYAQVEADSLPNPKPKAGDKPQKQKTGLYRSKDAGQTWEYMSELSNRPFYYNQVRVDPKNPERVYFSSLFFSDNGGKHSRNMAEGVHIDHHALWIDPNDPNRFVLGNDGGVVVTRDKGGNYDFGAVLPIAQFYAINYDMSVPYKVCAGAQDNGTWCGPSRLKYGNITNARWLGVSGGDGFYTAIDPENPNIVYSESQGGAMGRIDLSTREGSYFSRPYWMDAYRRFEDSLVALERDSAKLGAKEYKRLVAAVRTAQRDDSLNSQDRFNWNTPFILSPHNPRIFYAGGNRVLKSLDRGDKMFPISPDLSKKLTDRIEFSTNKTGGITLDATGAETYGTITTLAESYFAPGYLYAGTDDGNVWMTRNDGATWEQVPAKKFEGLPNDEVYVSRVEPSHFDSLTFYVAFDNHRVNDFTPYLYATHDGGQTFTSIAGDLPRGGPDYLHVIREDPHNRDLLFAGTSVGVYVSLDRGKTWQKFMAGMPTAPVHDLKIHPRDRELIAATHGRGIWIVDVAALEEMTPETLAKDVHLFQTKTYLEFPGDLSAYGEAMYGTGHQGFRDAVSPYSSPEIVYRVAADTKDTLRIIITDVKGDTLQNDVGMNTAGLHRTSWGMQGKPAPPEPLSPAQIRDSIYVHGRIKVVIDSLVGAKRLTRKAGDKLADAMVKGDYSILYGGMFASFGGGGPVPEADGWIGRPGEGGWVGDPPDSLKPKPAAAPAAKDSAAEDKLPPIDSLVPGGFEALSKLISGKRNLTVNAFGLARQGYGGDLPSGHYLVTIVVGAKKESRVVRIVRLKDRDPNRPVQPGEY